VVPCHLVPSISRLVSGSCASPRIFAPRFLQTPSRDDALALRFSFGRTCLERGLDLRAPGHSRHTRPRVERQEGAQLLALRSNELLGGLLGTFLGKDNARLNAYLLGEIEELATVH
jgi:hypothetical protein